MKRLLCLLLAAVTLAAAQNSNFKALADSGWILLFDGGSLFGWTAGPGAIWKGGDGSLVPGSNNASLRTNSAFADFILKFDYRTAGADTDCNVALRAAIDGDPTDTGYPLQIGEGKAGWPSGSIAGRFKANDMHPAVGQWHTVEATLAGDHISVNLDGRKVADGHDPRAKAGVIVLSCSTAGRAQFRNIMLKPLLSKNLFNGSDLSGWKEVGPPPPKKAGLFKKIVGGGGKVKEAQWSVTGGAIHGQGGTGQLETDTMYDDFVLQLAIRVNNPKGKDDQPSGGVGFRGDAGQLFTGYDLPLQNAYHNGNRAQPLPNSTGGLKGLQPPRRVLSSDNQYFTETIAAYGRHIQVWVNGVAVSDFQDTRAEGNSPQRAARTAPGTISLQSPDEKANLDFRSIQISQLPKMLGKGPAEATAVQPPPAAVPAVPVGAPGMPAMAQPNPNDAKVKALMAQALTTTDPQRQEEIYTQILLLDPSNAVAFAGRQQAQQKIDEANARNAQQQAQAQQQTQTESQKQSEGEAAKQNAETAFLHGDLDTAHTQIGVAEKDMSGDPTIQDLKGRIESAIQSRTRLRFLWGGCSVLALIGLITAWWKTRGKKSPYLEVVEGLDKGKKYNLDQDVAHIGAVAQDGGNKNEIVVRDLEHMISRFHCEIHKRNNQFFLIDCGSANGTRVDGNRAQPGKPVRLKSGTRVALAGTCTMKLGFEKRKQT